MRVAVRAPSSAPAWGRGRLVLVLVAVAGLGAVLLAGLAFAVAGTVRGDSTPADPDATEAPPTAARATPGQTRDTIAAAPMLPTTPADARPGRSADSAPAAITIPGATATDPLGIPTGFAHTEPGALGQLAAIATTVLGQLSVDYATAVYRDWSQPGGVGPQRWRLTRDVTTFLDTAGDRALLVARPAAAQVKGSDGPDWLVGCVLLELQTFPTTGAAATDTDARIAYGYCERMAWQDDRWVIAAGPEPAEAPHTWPGTERAGQAGWATWVAGS